MLVQQCLKRSLKPRRQSQTAATNSSSDQPDQTAFLEICEHINQKPDGPSIALSAVVWALAFSDHFEVHPINDLYNNLVNNGVEIPDIDRNEVDLLKRTITPNRMPEVQSPAATNARKTQLMQAIRHDLDLTTLDLPAFEALLQGLSCNPPDTVTMKQLQVRYDDEVVAYVLEEVLCIYGLYGTPTLWDPSHVWWYAQGQLRPRQPPAPSLISGLLACVVRPGSGGGGEECSVTLTAAVGRLPTDNYTQTSQLVKCVLCGVADWWSESQAAMAPS
ncbi:unnamed protein product [Schistocephalus solidus]|uniref:VHS domain-containing protein n=1 Tax=Schistocephalus solidus TaxID=70667 RepID=A0A183STD4_SCHSO|nr:unnamed protein product [Schistocephalus solidus]